MMTGMDMVAEFSFIFFAVSSPSLRLCIMTSITMQS